MADYHIHILNEAGKCVVRPHSVQVGSKQTVEWHMHGGNGTFWLVFGKKPPFEKPHDKNVLEFQETSGDVTAKQGGQTSEVYPYAVVTCDGDCVFSSGSHPDIIW